MSKIQSKIKCKIKQCSKIEKNFLFGMNLVYLLVWRNTILISKIFFSIENTTVFITNSNSLHKKNWLTYIWSIYEKFMFHQFFFKIKICSFFHNFPISICWCLFFIQTIPQYKTNNLVYKNTKFYLSSTNKYMYVDDDWIIHKKSISRLFLL